MPVPPFPCVHTLSHLQHTEARERLLALHVVVNEALHQTLLTASLPCIIRTARPLLLARTLRRPLLLPCSARNTFLLLLARPMGWRPQGSAVYKRMAEQKTIRAPCMAMQISVCTPFHS